MRYGLLLFLSLFLFRPTPVLSADSRDAGKPFLDKLYSYYYSLPHDGVMAYVCQVEPSFVTELATKAASKYGEHSEEARKFGGMKYALIASFDKEWHILVIEAFSVPSGDTDFAKEMRKANKFAKKRIEGICETWLYNMGMAQVLTVDTSVYRVKWVMRPSGFSVELGPIALVFDKNWTLTESDVRDGDKVLRAVCSYRHSRRQGLLLDSCDMAGETRSEFRYTEIDGLKGPVLVLDKVQITDGPKSTYSLAFSKWGITPIKPKGM